MQLISKFNKGFRFLLCDIHIYSKYAWVVTSKYKKCIRITYAFRNILDESVLKPRKIWVDKASQFYNRSMKSWLQDNDKEMYSAHNEGKYVAIEKFIKTLKSKIYKCTCLISKNAHVDKLSDVVIE